MNNLETPFWGGGRGGAEQCPTNQPPDEKNFTRFARKSHHPYNYNEYPKQYKPSLT